jgi:hypothetical protein
MNAPSLLLAFAHIQGEAKTPTGGVGMSHDQPRLLKDTNNGIEN